MRKFYPFGWIDRDLKNLGFLSQMSASAAKLYILYVLSGGTEGKSCYGIEALKEATGLSAPTIYKSRQELEDMRLIITNKEMVRGHKNKKPKIWVELQDLPVNELSIKRRSVILSPKRAKNLKHQQSQQKYDMPAWMQLGAERLRRKCST